MTTEINKNITLKLNEPQMESIKRISRLAKSAHYIDLRFRDNGEYKIIEADFLREFLSNLNNPLGDK